jgi:predicted amidohydrolase YtcJ
MKDRKIFINGDFFSLHAPRRRIQAIAVEDGVITDIGPNTRIAHLWRRGFKKHDLRKKFAVPAFTDAHLHLSALGKLSGRVNLDGISSLENAVSVIKKAATKLKPGQWLKGRGWNKNLWGGEFPHKSHLDKATTGPAALWSKDGHLIWANSAALSYFGISGDTPDPPGGVIEKDKNGELTGILKEKAADLLYDLIPAESVDEKIGYLLEGQKKLLKLGIVGVGDFDTWPTILTDLSALEQSKKLQLRICKMIYDDVLDESIARGVRTGQGNDHLRAGYLKLYADGALGSQTAYMFQPYIGQPGNFGVETLTRTQLENYIGRVVKAGISVAIHAIGDKANFQTIQAIKRYSSDFQSQNLAPRIEHAQILRKTEIGLFGKFGITASVQPIHATSDRDVADNYWGKRSRFAYPFRSLWQSGAALAFGSDAPIETADPLAGIHAAVTRKRPGDKNPWYPEERLPVTRALATYTIGSARACRFDDITGSIEVGKKADFVVLCDDIIRTNNENIHRACVLSTIVDGRIVYGANNLS